MIDETAGMETQRVEYVYDVMGRRIAKTVDADGAGSADATTTHFVYDRDNVSLEFVGQNATPTQRYLHGPQIDQVLAQEDNSGEVLWLLSDHLGTVKDLVDATGNVLNHRTYDSYGNLITQSNEEFSSRYGFTGREFDDELGQYFYRARYYDPSLGKFISQDPIGFEGKSYNLHKYVGNNPVSFTDSTGMCPDDDFGECWFRCMESQGAEYALLALGITMATAASIPKPSGALWNSSPFTTGLSLLNVFLRGAGVITRGDRTLRLLGRRLNPYANAVAAFSVGYLIGSAAKCGSLCSISTEAF